MDADRYHFRLSDFFSDLSAVHLEHNLIGGRNEYESKSNDCNFSTIMQSGDNEYYTRRAVDGSYLYAGSLFMDYRCSSDFSDFNSVIYGHNMGNGTMFADIPNYENEEFFMNHSFGWLTTEDEVRLIDFFAVARTTDTSGLYLADSIFEEWDSQIRNCASIYKEIGISEEDNLITLSTCTSAEGNSRTILVGKIIKESDIE